MLKVVLKIRQISYAFRAINLEKQKFLIRQLYQISRIFASEFLSRTSTNMLAISKMFLHFL